MKRKLMSWCWAVVAALLLVQPSLASPPSFVRLAAVPPPTIVAASEEYPGGHYRAEHLVDGQTKTAYSSHAKGTETFVEFDFGEPTLVAGFRHQDRDDPATVAASQLTFLDAVGETLTSVSVPHVNQRAGVTYFALPESVVARRVRWQVTKLGSQHSTVGGAEIAFYAAGEAEQTPRGIGIEAQAVAIIERQGDDQVQPLRVTFDYPYASPLDVTLHVGDCQPRKLRLQFGRQILTETIPALESERRLSFVIEAGGAPLVQREITLRPARKSTIYLLPHSHTDIGYTELQTEIEDKQVNNLLLGMEHARRTADYPPGARFVWNVEVLWAADLYLRRLDAAQRTAFLEAVRRGEVALCGMYLNELTGLCRPEELLRLFRLATQLGELTGVPIDTAMISDVPGYTWGTVTAMAHAGIKYFSVAPNYFDRIGDILVQWENKPFYWVGPTGRDQVLVWIPYKGYATSHVYRALSREFVEHFQTQLEQTDYPYEIAYLRWAGQGDNAAPDAAICEFVKDWSARYVWPKFVIASASEAFAAFERRYGDQLPRVRGDWTPYWEDGAGSSALETGRNRASSDRLAQAEALWALQNPATYPADDFETAYRHVLLYSEHTWGAWCSVSEPNRRETREQWSIKQSYAVTADLQSRELLSRALGQRQQAADKATIDVFNTNSWPRSDLVVVPKYLSEGRYRVIDEQGQPLPSQRLRSGELAFLARAVPPLAARRYTLQDGPPHAEAGPLKVSSTTLENGLVSVRVDEQTGGLVELRAAGLDANLADSAPGNALNDYLYLVGDQVAEAQRSGPATITVHETGPLVASLLIESDAPGCFRLCREVRLVAGQDHVELINLVDKRRIVAASYHAPEGKESVNFAFPFQVPDGQVRLEVPFGVLRPDTDQIPSACKNWFTLGRWADVANNEFGVTWVSLDAPLVQVGGLTATLLNSQSNPDTWRKQVGPTQRLVSWAMNNHWGTNYRAHQEGPTVFRFALRPHRGYEPAAAARLAIGLSQPLLAAGARGESPQTASRLTVNSPDVLVTGLKPSDDGRAVIVRLWNASDRDVSTSIVWSQPVPHRVWCSDLSENPRQPLAGPLTLPAWGLVTLRGELAAGR